MTSPNLTSQPLTTQPSDALSVFDVAWWLHGGGGGGGEGGTVTSVGLVLPSIFTVSGSPVTAAGDLTAILADQAANTVLAGPATGADDAPAFRALVEDDLPAHEHSADDITSGMTDGQLIIGDTGGPPVLATLTAGAGITITNGAGTVTIAVSGGSSGGVLTRTFVNAHYTILTSDHLIAVDTGTALILTLPSAASAGVGKPYIVKDETGTAGTNNIAIATPGAETIDGSASNLLVSTNFGSVSLYTDGTNWFTFANNA